MRNLIIYATNSGTTKEIAEEINSLLIDKATIIDAQKFVEQNSEIDFSSYDNIIMGTNVRFNRINRYFKKCAKIINAELFLKENKPNIYCYISGCDYEDANDIAADVSVTLAGKPIVFFVGGSLAENGVQSLKNIIMNKIINNSIPKVYPIDHYKIEKLAEMVNGTIIK